MTGGYRAPSQLSVTDRPLSRASTTATSTHTHLNIATKYQRNGGDPSTIMKSLTTAQPYSVRIDSNGDDIRCLEWGMPGGGAQNMLAYCSQSSLHIVHVAHVVDDDGEDDEEEIDGEEAGKMDRLSITELASYQMPCNSAAPIKLAWSHLSFCDSQLLLDEEEEQVPFFIRIACCCTDGIIRVFNSSLKDSPLECSLSGHLDFVNDISFDPHDESGLTLASASDDHSFRIWNCETGESSVYYTQSECLAIRYHPQRNNWLLVADSLYNIAIYNTETGQPFMQLVPHSESFPQLNMKQQQLLNSIDWCLADYERICATIGSHFYQWKLTVGKPIITAYSKGQLSRSTASSSTNRIIKCSPSSELFALTSSSSQSTSTGKYGYQILLYRFTNSQSPFCAILTPNVPQAHGARIDTISWTILGAGESLNPVNVLAASSNQSIYFWRTH